MTTEQTKQVSKLSDRLRHWQNYAARKGVMLAKDFFSLITEAEALELLDQAQGEPVAWMNADTGNVSIGNSEDFAIPLFAHPPKEAPAEPTEEELVKMLRGGQITVRPLEAPVSSIVEAAIKAIKEEFGNRRVIWPLDQRIMKHCDQALAALSSPAPTAMVLTSQIKTAYAGNHAYYMDNKPEGSTYREHCKLLMEELIDELQEDGYLSSPKPQVSVDEIMEAHMDHQAWIASRVYVPSNQNIEDDLRARLTKLMDR